MRSTKVRVRAKPGRKIRRLKRAAPAISRIQDILESSKVDSPDMRKKAYLAIHDHLFLRLQQVIAKQAKQESWDFMRGCFYQATEVYAVASLAYYGYDNPIMSDEQYDTLCAFLAEHYLEIPPRARTEYQLSSAMLRAGSGYTYGKDSRIRALQIYERRLQELDGARKKNHVRERTRHKARILRKAPTRRIKRPPRKA